MSRLSCAVVIATLLIAALATPTFAQGGGRGGGRLESSGFGGGPGGAFGTPWAGGQLYGSATHPNYTRMVVVGGAGGLSSTVRGLVAAELVHRLRSSAKETESVENLRTISLGQPMGIASQGFDDLRLGDDSLIQSLTISLDAPNAGPADDAAEFTEQDEARVAALWEQSRSELEKALQSAQQRITDQQRREFNRNYDVTEERLLVAQKELALVIDKIEGATQESSPDELRSQLEGARKTLNELSLDRVSAEARREAIVARIDELRAKGEDAAASDPLIAELEKIVAIRERQLEAVRDQWETGTFPTVAISDAETEMAKARVELLKAKRAAMVDAAGGVVQELNNELSRLIVQLAEGNARSKALQQQVAELQQATSVSNTTRAEQLSQKLLVLQHRVAELEEAKAELDSQAPPAAEEITITPLDEALSLSGEIEDDGNAAQSDH